MIHWEVALFLPRIQVGKPTWLWQVTDPSISSGSASSSDVSGSSHLHLKLQIYLTLFDLYLMSLMGQVHCPT